MRAVFHRPWGALLLLSCATTGPSLPPPKVVVMEEMRIQEEPDPLTGLDTFDASDLLERGNQLFDAKDYTRAILVYDRLVTAFADSGLAPTALYNAGLAHERSSDFDAALGRFRRILDVYPSASAARDARFRAAVCLSKLNRWSEVADAFHAIRQLPDLPIMDELEARVGMGVAFFMAGDEATSERELLHALRFYEAKEKEEYLPAHYWVGQARYYLGEIYSREFETYALLVTDEADPERWKDKMAERLEEKCQRLLRAQNNLIRAIRAGHPGWATASGYRIGSLYERLYDDMLEVPLPPGLGADAGEVYLDELKKKLAILVGKAIQVYERSLEMAERVGEKNEWVERAERALARMRTLGVEAMRAEDGTKASL